MQRSSALSKLSTWVWRLNDHRKPQRVTPPPFYSWHLPEPEWPAWGWLSILTYSQPSPKTHPEQIWHIDNHWHTLTTKSEQNMTPYDTSDDKIFQGMSCLHFGKEDAWGRWSTYCFNRDPSSDDHSVLKQVRARSAQHIALPKSDSNLSMDFIVNSWEGPHMISSVPFGWSMVKVSKVSKVSKCASAAAVHVCPPFVPCPPPFPPMAKLARSCAHIAHTCCLILVWMTRRGMQFTIRCLKAADLHAVDPQNMKGADKHANPQTGSSPTPQIPHTANTMEIARPHMIAHVSGVLLKRLAGNVGDW